MNKDAEWVTHYMEWCDVWADCLIIALECNQGYSTIEKYRRYMMSCYNAAQRILGYDV